MSDIGVSTTLAVLKHKMRDGKGSEGMECFWTFTRQPTVKPGERLWFAADGAWQGYFIVKDVDFDGEVEVHSEFIVTFDSESWKGEFFGPRKPFQGFTYKVPEVSS